MELEECLILQAKIEKTPYPCRPNPAAKEFIGFPLPNKRIDFNDIPPALICVSDVTCEVHLTEDILMGNLYTHLFCITAWERRGIKEMLGWILQEQLNVGLEERLSYGRPSTGWDSTFNCKIRAWKRNLEGFSREISVFISHPPLDIVIPVGQVCLWWKQVYGRTYPGWTWFLLSFLLVWSKRKLSANRLQLWELISNSGKGRGPVGDW